MANRVICAVFAILILGVAAAGLILPDRAYSENENRYLAQLPEVSLSAIASGELTSGVENYVTDQFPLRDGWVSLKTQFELMLNRHDSGGIYIAREGYLPEMFTSYDEAQLEKNLFAVKRLFDAVDASGTLMLVPTGACVMADLLPSVTGEVDQSAIAARAQDFGLSSVDAIAALRSHADECVYYRTDHHYTSLGAYYCYAAFMEKLGLPHAALGDFSRVTLSESFYGTTYSRAGYYAAKPDVIDGYIAKNAVAVEYNLGERVTDTLFEEKHLETKDKYSVFMGGNQAVVKITREGGNGRALLIVKDSYANSFVQFAAADFSAVHMLDPRYFSMSVAQYARDNGITDVLVLYGIKSFCEDKRAAFIA